MTSNVKTNLNQTAAQGLGFAFALLKSLARVVSGAGPQNEPVMTGHSIPTLQNEVEGSSPLSAPLPVPAPIPIIAPATMGSVQPAVISAPSTAKKPLPRPADHSRVGASADSPLAATQIVAVLDPSAGTAFTHHWNLESGGKRADANSSVLHDSSMPMESGPALEDPLPPDPEISSLPVPAEVSTTAGRIPMEIAGADAARLQPTLPSLSEQTPKPAARPQDRATSAKPAPPITTPTAPIHPADELTVRTKNIPARALQPEAGRENASPVPSREQAATKTQSSAPLKTGEEFPPPVVHMERSAGNSPQPSGDPRTDPDGRTFSMPAGFLNGILISKSPSIPVDQTFPAPPIPATASPAGTANPAPRPPEAALDIAIPAELPAAPRATDSAETGTAAVRVPRGASRGEAPAIAQVKYRESSTDGASSGAEENIHKGAGKNNADRAANSAPDHRQAHPATALPEPASAAHPKSELAAPVRAAQQATESLVSPSKPVSGEASTKADNAAPLPKGGPPSDALNSPHGEDPSDLARIQSGRLVSEAGKSDVRIALQGEQMGRVELHARFAGDQVSASITTERPDTHAFLSGQLPSLHQLLNERRIQVSEIILFHDSLPSAASPQDDGAHAQREQTSPHTAHGQTHAGGVGAELAAGASEARTGAGRIFDYRGRLNVRA